MMEEYDSATRAELEARCTPEQIAEFRRVLGWDGDAKPDMSTFSKGEQCLYCKSCQWQTTRPSAMRPVCPECGSQLYLWKAD